MAGNGRNWLEIAYMAGNGLTKLHMIRYGWKRQKWLEMAGMAGNG